MEMIRFKAKNFWILCCGVILAVTFGGCSNYNGEQLFQTEGCITCHRFKGTGGSMGPDLTAISQIKSDNSIHSYLKNPKQFNQQARMPSFAHLSNNKRKAIITFLRK
jgi:cytochrome c2